MPGRCRTLTALLTMLALLLSIGQSARAASCVQDVATEVTVPAHAHGDHAAPQSGATSDTPRGSCPFGHDSMAACTAAVPLPAPVTLVPAPTEIASESPPARDDYALFLLSADLFHPPRC